MEKIFIIAIISFLILVYLCYLIVKNYHSNKDRVCKFLEIAYDLIFISYLFLANKGLSGNEFIIGNNKIIIATTIVLMLPLKAIIDTINNSTAIELSLEMAKTALFLSLITIISFIISDVDTYLSAVLEYSVLLIPIISSLILKFPIEIITKQEKHN